MLTHAVHARRQDGREGSAEDAMIIVDDREDVREPHPPLARATRSFLFPILLLPLPTTLSFSNLPPISPQPPIALPPYPLAHTEMRHAPVCSMSPFNAAALNSLPALQVWDPYSREAVLQALAPIGAETYGTHGPG